MAKRKKQTLDDFTALFDSLSSTDTGIDFSRLEQCQTGQDADKKTIPSESTPEPAVPPVSDFPTLPTSNTTPQAEPVSKKHITHKNLPPPPGTSPAGRPAADDIPRKSIDSHAQPLDDAHLANTADTTEISAPTISEYTENNEFLTASKSTPAHLCFPGDTTHDTTLQAEPASTKQITHKNPPPTSETSPAGQPAADDTPRESIYSHAQPLDDAHLASTADTTENITPDISEHHENNDFLSSSKPTSDYHDFPHDTTYDTTSEHPDEISENNDLLLFWESMNPNARELYRYLAELPEMRLSLRSAPILDCKGKTMLYLTRRRSFDTLCAKGVITAHVKFAVGSYQGMTFELNETLRDPFFHLYPDPPYASGDTTSDTTTQKAMPAATKETLPETPPVSGTRLELHPEYAFWRDHGLGQRQITRWQKEFNMDEVLLDCYLRWAAWSIGQKNKDGSGKPIDKPVSWFYKILRQNGAFEKPSDYRSYEDLQADRLQAILEERRQSREKVSRIRSEIETLDLEGELDAIIEAGSGNAVYDRLVSGVAPAAMKKPDLLRQILLERFRELRSRGEL